jgi:methyltransferase (TIGR00027 family)
MSSGEARVEHVSDTALLVAAARAFETERPDGLIRDPFARRLTGARGMALVPQSTDLQGWMALGIGLRTRTVDDVLVETVASHGIRTVMILGAGLDTRPWRLDLPRELRWIEVDFPEILRYKTNLLAGETPKCRVEQMPADLNDAAQRQAVFTAAGSAPGLILTEGLLLYLPATTTEAIATEPAQLSGIRYWVVEIAAFVLMRNAHQGKMEDIERVRAKDRVEGQGILDLVERNGWRCGESRSYTAKGFALARERGLSITSEGKSVEDPSGIYLYQR